MRVVVTYFDHTPSGRRVEEISRVLSAEIVDGVYVATVPNGRVIVPLRIVQKVEEHL